MPLRARIYVGSLVALIGLLCLACANLPGVRGKAAQDILLLLPVLYVIYRSCRRYLVELEAEKKHAEQIAALHLRTIEALVLAIEAKDRATKAHLSRVRGYAVEIGRAFGLHGPELEALRVAALLHDIGKIAVPEHILAKPGRLTPEEFEKMKIHPVVGSEIVERVKFPYPVAPIVRAHHEKWDGTGYPDGLKGDEIPLGGRILAVVDCLDALLSDRQYRPALPLDEGIAEVVRRSGRDFDPKVVEMLQQMYPDLERRRNRLQSTPLLSEISVRHGDAPGAGFEVPPEFSSHGSAECAVPLALTATRQEAQLLCEMAQASLDSVAPEEAFRSIAAHVKRLVPYDAMAIYVMRHSRLIREFACGDQLRLPPLIDIPIGRGLSGWVVRTGQPLLNGNPGPEAAGAALHSALAVPLNGSTGTIGVVTLYRAESDAFAPDHLRILLAAASKIAPAVENALKVRRIDSTTTDYLTDLPNAGSLLLRLENELARSRRTNEPLTILLCDLDNFREVNERHGHHIGNKVLRAIGSAFRECCREYDYVARMGSDEFVLILPASDGESLRGRIGELQQIGERAGRQAVGSDEITMTVGEAAFPQDGAQAEQLLAVAAHRRSARHQATVAS